TYTEATFRNDLVLATPRLTAGCAVPPCTQNVRAADDLPLVPRHRLNASLDYHPTSWLTLWIGGSYVGAQRLRGDEANEEQTLGDYVVVNGGGGQRAIAQTIGTGLLENDAERTGHCGHRPPGVGALGAAAVAPQDRQGSPRAFSNEHGAGHQAQRRDPCRDEIQHVVESRRGLAEILEHALAVPEHRVGGVDHAVRGGPREPSDEKEARRRQESVGEVL